MPVLICLITKLANAPELFRRLSAAGCRVGGTPGFPVASALDSARLKAWKGSVSKRRL